jgi:uncharacterized protein
VVAHSSPLKTLSFALLFTVGGAFAAYADDPTPAALDSARTIIAAWGMTKSFDLVIPQMFDQLERDVVRTRPELKDSLHATVTALKPEFAKSEQDFINSSALSLAKMMTEQELKDTATFFQTPSGKKYIETEPAAITQIVTLVQNWRQQLSVDVMKRTREEMKKKGADF